MALSAVGVGVVGTAVGPSYLASNTLQESSIPSYRRSELNEIEPDIELVNDLLAGTRRMQDKSQKYIRKWYSEDQSVYDIRRKIEKVFGGLSRTLSASIGMIYAKTPQVNWNASESAMKEQWDNIDALGTKGFVFVKRFSEWALRDGLAAILVDHTSPPAGTLVTAGNEGLLNLRPLWAAYDRCSILNWRVSTINNQKVLTQVTLRECATVDIGVYGVQEELHYRVLRLVPGLSQMIATWTLYRAKRRGAYRPEDFEPIGAGVFRDKNGLAFDHIPLNIAYCGRSDAPMTATIPLMDVAWSNLSHWQQSSNLRFYREVAAFPQPTVVGSLATQPGIDASGQRAMIAGTLKIGPMVSVHLQAGGEFKFTELVGSSMEQLAKGIEQEEWHMSQLGMSFLAKNPRQQETAEAKRLDATAENSTLATASQGIEDCVNGALQDHAQYLGIEKAGSPVTQLSRDYDMIAMDAQTMAVYVQACKDAGLPPRILLEAWQSGGRLPPDTDLDSLETEMLANQAAAAELANAKATMSGGGGPNDA
jgi:hypothetical protein